MSRLPMDGFWGDPRDFGRSSGQELRRRLMRRRLTRSTIGWPIAWADKNQSFCRLVSRGWGHQFHDPDRLPTLREQLAATKLMLEWRAVNFETQRNREPQRLNACVSFFLRDLRDLRDLRASVCQPFFVPSCASLISPQAIGRL
jgi:hypothetical protein